MHAESPASPAPGPGEPLWPPHVPWVHPEASGSSTRDSSGSGTVPGEDAREVGKGHCIKPLSSAHASVRVFSILKVQKTLSKMQVTRPAFQGFSLREFGEGLRKLHFIVIYKSP